jgi:hypothetical protein
VPMINGSHFWKGELEFSSELGSIRVIYFDDTCVV